MNRQFEFRQLNVSDLPQLERHFPTPRRITHHDRLRTQSNESHSLYGFFHTSRLIACGQIKRLGSHDPDVISSFPHPEICSIYVRPDYRNQHLAREMIIRLEKILLGDDFMHAGVIVNATNHAARKLYDTLCYKEIKSLAADKNGPRIYLLKPLMAS